MIGRGAVLPAFETAVIGMGEGETKKITVPPEKAYGPYDDELVYVVERNLLPPGTNPEVGIDARRSAQLKGSRSKDR